METTFFSQVAMLNLTGNIRLTIQPQEEGQMIVSLLLSNKDVKDAAVAKIPPLVLKGSATELDAGFFEAVTQPVQRTNQLLCNLVAHEKAMEKAGKENRIQKDKENELRKDKEAKQKKFDEQMKKVVELEKQKKIGQALGALPKLADFPAFAEEIQKKSNELKKQHGSFSLFEAQVEEADSAQPNEPDENEDPEDDDPGEEDYDPEEEEVEDEDDEN